MPQVFAPRANTIARVIVFGGIAMIAAAIGIGIAIARSPYVTREGRPPAQPVPFSHRHHVGGLGIDCRYCHDSVEDSAFAGLPATETCMSCHHELWTEADVLEPVRASARTGRPVRWQRVHDLPDFVYFDHSIHVRQGVGCVSCHGRVDRMAVVEQTESLDMRWCLDCHRDPAPRLRPRERVFDMAWRAPDDHAALGRALVERFGIAVGTLTECSICHR